jgi:hypothetical protein
MKRGMTKEKAKKLFFTFLDAVILLCFGLSVYFTLVRDYTRTILFMSMGTLFLMFFIVRGILRVHKKDFKL